MNKIETAAADSTLTPLELVTLVTPVTCITAAVADAINAVRLTAHAWVKGFAIGFQPDSADACAAGDGALSVHSLVNSRGRGV
jgi:hypothetical protein